MKSENQTSHNTKSEAQTLPRGGAERREPSSTMVQDGIASTGNLALQRRLVDAAMDGDQALRRSRGIATSSTLGNQALQHELGSTGRLNSAPLPYRAEMSSLFHSDFSVLGIVLGARNELSHLGAAAATDGETVAFASNRPSRRQVAHELAHVMQYRRAPMSATGTQRGAEAEAAEAARLAETGRAPRSPQQTPAARILHDDPPVCEPRYGSFVLDPALNQATPNALETQVFIQSPGGDGSQGSYLALERRVYWSDRVVAYAVPLFELYTDEAEAQAAVSTDVDRMPDVSAGQTVWTASGSFVVDMVDESFAISRTQVVEAAGAGAVVVLDTETGTVLVDSGLQFSDESAGPALGHGLAVILGEYIPDSIAEGILTGNGPSGSALPYIAQTWPMNAVRGSFEQYASGEVANVAAAQTEYREWLEQETRTQLEAGRAQWESEQPLAPNNSLREQRWQAHLESELAALVGDYSSATPIEMRSAEIDESGALQPLADETAVTLPMDADGLIDLGDVEWEVDDSVGALSFTVGDQFYMFPAAGLVLRPLGSAVPEIRPTGDIGPGPRPPRPVTPWVAMAAVGKEGLALVRTSAGVGLLIDAGGPRVVTMAAINFMEGELGVSMQGQLVTHPHTDHVRQLLRVIKERSIRPQDLIMARSWRQTGIVESLRTTTDPDLLGLGYGPAWEPSFVADAEGVTHTRFSVGGNTVDVYGNTAAHENYRQQLQEQAAGTLDSIRSDVVDSAGLITVIGNESSATRTAIIADFRGTDITAMHDAMEASEPGSFARAMRDVRVIKGAGHHFSLTAGRTPADIAGLDLLLEHTLVRNGELTIMVQTREGFAFGPGGEPVGEAGAFLRYFTSQGARVVMSTSPSEGQRSGAEHSGAVLDSSGAVSTSGEQMRVFESTNPRSVEMHRRLGLLREASRTLTQSPEFAPTALGMEGRNATELLLQVNGEIAHLEGLARELRGVAGADLLDARDSRTSTRAVSERQRFRDARTSAGRSVDVISEEMTRPGVFERALSEDVVERLRQAAERGRSVAVDVEFANMPRPLFEALETLPSELRESLGRQYRELASLTADPERNAAPASNRLEMLARVETLRGALERGMNEAPAEQRAVFEAELQRLRQARARLRVDTVSTVELGRDMMGRSTRTEYIRYAGENLVHRGFHEVGRAFGALMVIHSVQGVGALAEDIAGGEVTVPEGALRAAHSLYGINIGVRMVRTTTRSIAAAEAAGAAVPGVRLWEFAVLAVLEVGAAHFADHESSEAHDAAVLNTALHSSVNLLCMYAGQGIMTWAAASPLLPHPALKAAGMGLGLAVMMAGEPILGLLSLDDDIERMTGFLPGEVTHVNQEIGAVLEDYRVMIGSYLLQQRSDSELHALGVGNPEILKRGMEARGDTTARSVRDKELELVGLFESAYERARGASSGLRVLDAQADQFARLRYLAMRGRWDPNQAAISERFNQMDSALGLENASAETIREMEQWSDLEDKFAEVNVSLTANLLTDLDDADELFESYQELQLMMENARYRLDPTSRGGFRPAALLPECSLARGHYIQELNVREVRLSNLHATLSNLVGGETRLPLDPVTQMHPATVLSRLRMLREQYQAQTGELAARFPALSNRDIWNDTGALAREVVIANRADRAAFNRLRLAEMNLQSASRMAGMALINHPGGSSSVESDLIQEEEARVTRLVNARQMVHGLIFPGELDNILQNRTAQRDSVLATQIDLAFGRQTLSGESPEPLSEEELLAADTMGVTLTQGGELTSTQQLLQDLRQRRTSFRSVLLGEYLDLTDYELLHRVVERYYFTLRSPYHYYDDGWVDTFPERSFSAALQPLMVQLPGSKIGSESSWGIFPAAYHRMVAVNPDAVRAVGSSPILIRGSDLIAVSQQDIEVRAAERGSSE